MKKHNTESSKYLGCKQAATYINMSKEWLGDARKSGYGPAFRKLGVAKNAPIRYKKSDLDAYMDSRKVKVA